MEILYILQGAAALFGALTGVFYFSERFTRYRPSAIFLPKHFGATKGAVFAYLRVQNRSDRPILIELPGKAPAGYFMAAMDHETVSILRAVVRTKVTAVLEPGAARDFPLLKPINFEGADEESYLHALVAWRHPQPIWWIGNRTIRAVIRKADYRLLMSDDVGLHSDDQPAA